MIATTEFATNAIVTLNARHGEMAGSVVETYSDQGQIVGVCVTWTEDDGQTYNMVSATGALTEMVPGERNLTLPLPREYSHLRAPRVHPKRVAHAAEFPQGCDDRRCALGCIS